ncbi:MAG: hypothetical protein ABSC23_18930 [Bryobacteraceae bacterium]
MGTTRRGFLAGISAPIILGATDKAGSKRLVIGEGAWKFEWIGDWGQLPSHIKWGNTHNVVEDAQGNIYVHHTVYADSEIPDSMVVFDHKGKFVRSWGKEFRGVAHGMWLNKEGREEFLYLTVNAANRRMQPQPELPATILKTTLRGEIVWKVHGPPDIAAYASQANGVTPPYNPTNLAIAPNGDVYVADGYGSYYVNHYSSKGEYLNTFGGRGSDPGQLNEPHGIWMDMRTGSPILTVADRRNHRLQRFTLDGKHIDFVSGFRLPCHFHEQKGNVVIPDLQGRVTIVDRKNQVILHLGDSNPAVAGGPIRTTKTRDAFTPGQFVCPHGACFDHAGNIFVVEWVEIGRVTKLRRVA